MNSALAYIKHGRFGGPICDVSQEKNCSKSEKCCRSFFERHYGVPFKSTRSLPFLKNPETGRILELDGYNEKLKVAFEYNGRQHYEWPNHTNQTEEDFIQQKRRDMFKREQCDKNGIFLITVPYTVKDIPKFIAEADKLRPK
jgi:hypothetical protein